LEFLAHMQRTLSPRLNVQVRAGSQLRIAID
jgi:hypothetical protein